MSVLTIYSTENGKNETLGWLISIGFHSLIFLFFFFTLAVKQQIPAPPEYGIEVNFGTSDEGFGDVQNFSPPGPDPAPDKAEATPTTPVDEIKSQEPEAAEPEKVITGEDETVNITPEKQPARTEVEPAPAPVKQSPTKPTAQSLFPSDKTSPSNNNNGNKPGTVGDMGVKNGDPDARSQYSGNPGIGKGGKLEMVGWKWDKKPTINDESAEEGKIVFQVKVDEEGNIIAVNVLEKNVSPALVKKYQKEVEELSFSRTSGGNTGEGATGRITFLITSK